MGKQEIELVCTFPFFQDQTDLFRGQSINVMYAHGAKFLNRPPIKFTGRPVGIDDVAGFRVKKKHNR